MTIREPKIGDHVAIHALLSEVDNKEGDIIAIANIKEPLPYIIRLNNYDITACDLFELELCDYDSYGPHGWNENNC